MLLEIIFSLLLYFVGFIIGYFLGFRKGYQYALISLNNALKKIEEALLKIKDSHNKPISNPVNFTDCKLEVYNDIMYLYETKTDNFLCQAKTFEELAILLNKLGIGSAKVLHDNENFYFINGEFKKDQP
jgi:hypothetical protein